MNSPTVPYSHSHQHPNTFLFHQRETPCNHPQHPHQHPQHVFALLGLFALLGVLGVLGQTGNVPSISKGEK
jgi:hypothetical protein